MFPRLNFWVYNIGQSEMVKYHIYHIYSVYLFFFHNYDTLTPVQGTLQLRTAHIFITLLLRMYQTGAASFLGHTPRC